MPEIKISELTSAIEPSGGEILAIVQSNTTHKTTIDSLKPALVDNLSTGAPTWDVNGNLTAGFDIIAGGNHDGKVALTINDGYGNANLTFNHTDGIPDVNGSSGRISCNVDSNQELMAFQLKSSVTGGTPVTLTTVLRLYEDAIQLLTPATCLTPTQGTHVARKDYVDTALNLKATTASVTAVNSSLTNHIDEGHPTIHAALSHTHTIGDITSLQTSLDSKIGEAEINTDDFTFANDTLSLKTILEGQIGTGAVSPSKLSTGAPTWTETGQMTFAGNIYADQIIGRETANSLILRADPQSPQPTTGGPQIELYSADHPGVPNQIYVKSSFVYFNTVATTPTRFAGINPNGPTDAKDLTTKEYVDKNKSTFQKFSDFQDSSVSSFYRTVSYINNNGKLCAVGHGNNYDLAGFGSNYLIAGSSPEIMVPLAAGESVINTFSNGAGAPTMYLLTDQNRVFSTGHNGQGQCGRSGTTQQHYFDRIPQLDGTTWVSPNSGANTDGHMGAVRNGQLYMWGYGNQGQLGNGSADQANTPILINTGALAGKTITKVYTHTHYGYTFVIDSNRDVYATGYNVEGQLGLGDYTNRNTFAKVLGIKADDIILSHGSNASSSYIINGTTLYSTGDNNVGQLGHGNLTKRNTFLAVPGVSAKTVSVGGHRSANVVCLQTDGTVKVWGHNNRGQLGLGNTTNRSSPVTLTAAGNDVVKALTHDNYGYTAILKADGTIYTAGYNGHGQLGVGDTTNRNTLTKIVMDNNIQFKDIALFGYNGGTQFIAIDQDNGMWGCGYNSQWSLGLNYTYNPITILAKLSIS